MRHARLPHHLTRGPTGLFHFRLIVPADLRATVGRSVIKHSLRTRSPGLAVFWAQALALEYAGAFARYRGRAMDKPPSVEEILRAHREGRTQDYTVKVTARGVSIAADGAEDHARALEAIGKIPDLWRNEAHPAGTASPSAPFARALPSLSLDDAGRDYFQMEQRSLRRNTKEARTRAFESFKRHFGGLVSVSTITRPAASDWAKELVQGGSSKATVRNYVSHVAQIFDHLIRTGRLTDNPVKGVVIMKLREKAARLASGYTWEAFDDHQLREIYKPENLKRARTEHVRWAALIGLYSGARVGEVAQLYLRDFSKVDGIDYVSITNVNEDQTLKTDSSKRMVPIHPI